MIKFLSLIFAGLLLTASCIQQKQEAKKETVQTETLVKTTVSINKSSKADTVKPVFQNPCSQIVYEILTTSDSYKNLTDGLTERVIKNGGTSFGFMCEGSPTPKIDSATNYSKTYDYSVHESYPDHAPVIARYSFDPVQKQLFEYNTALDSLIPISFNKNLLLDLDKACIKN